MVEFDFVLNRFRDRETGAFVSGKMFKNIFHAAASISKDAKRTIKRGKASSPVGQPPRTRRGLLRRAIRFSADRQTQSAVIGPMESVVGGSASPQEFGGSYKGQNYEERPFMGPALERNLHRLGGEFSGSIGA